MAAIQATARGASLEQYGALPNVDHMTISPDATKDAYVKGFPDHRLVVIQDLTTGKPVRALNIGDIKVRNLKWAGNEHLLIVTSTATKVAGLLGPMHEYFSVEDLNLADGRQVPLIDKDVDGHKTLLNTFVGEPQVRTINGHITVFVAGVFFPSNHGQTGLFTVDLETHRTKLIDDRSSNARSWVIATDGAVIAREDIDQATSRWSLFMKAGGEWVGRNGTVDPVDLPSLIGLDAAGDGVLLRTRTAVGDRLVDVPIDPAKPSTTSPDPLGRIIEDDATGRAIANHTDAYHFFKPEDQRFWDAIVKAYAGEVVQLVSQSADGKVIIVEVVGAKDGAIYSYVDRTTKHADGIADLYDGLAPKDLSPVVMISYPAADGLTIPAYLTLPRDRMAKGLPLIVLPHGGPQASDQPGFDWISQALAAQGYAVLQPEYRGSTNFGMRLQEAGYGEWGRKMQTDLSDGVRMLAKNGTIDSARVCIVGASYGGYAALAGAAFDPGIYRCAVSVSGPSDLQGMLKYEQYSQHRDDSLVTRFWMRSMGAKSVDDPALAAVSPALHAEQIKIPVLLIHGEDDTVVEFKQSKIMKRALEDAGRPTTLVRLDSEDHWLSRPETRTQMLKATVDFLKANNPPG